MSDQSNDTGAIYEAPEIPETPSPSAPEPPARRGRRRDGGWIIGAILIALGIIFLLQNQGYTFLRNWWALFILIPAFSAFRDAWWHYQDAGHFNPKVRNHLFTGLLLTLICGVLLFGLSWTFFGPAILILIGLGILANAMLSGEKE
jgi:drug/metabolite transporter (DMT)-like permease